MRGCQWKATRFLALGIRMRTSRVTSAARMEPSGLYACRVRTMLCDMSM